MLLPCIDNALDVLLAKAVRSSILHIAILCVDEEDALKSSFPFLFLSMTMMEAGMPVPKKILAGSPIIPFLYVLDKVFSSTKVFLYVKYGSVQGQCIVIKVLAIIWKD